MSTTVLVQQLQFHFCILHFLQLADLRWCSGTAAQAKATEEKHSVAVQRIPRVSILVNLDFYASLGHMSRRLHCVEIS